MENQDEILKKITSGEEQLVREAIKEIKENGDLSLADVLLDSIGHIPEDYAESAIINLLADIKETGFSEILIRKLKGTTNTALKAIILRIAWESSLNYSAYWELFLDMLLKDDFQVALEAATALENMLPQLSGEQQTHLLSALQQAQFSEEKKFLTENILNAIRMEEEDLLPEL